MRKLTTVILMSLATTGAYAADQSPNKFGGDVAITSDYVFRGISNSDNKPAVSGDVTYSYEPLGIYASLWASSINFNAPDDTVETDWTAGIGGSFFNTGLSYDLGNVYYWYPGNSPSQHGYGNYNYDEVYFGLSYDFSSVPFTPSVGAKVYYSPDFFGETGDAYYIDGSIGFSLPHDFSLNTHVGHQYIDNNGGASTEYTDWKIGLSKEVFGFGLDVSYTAVDDQAATCGSTLCGDKVFFTISRGF
jgi:uncharacterized protein (TIGR02001 family)